MADLDDSRREPGPPDDSPVAAPSGGGGRPRGSRLWHLLLVPAVALSAVLSLLGARRGDDETSAADYEELGERRAGQPALAG